ncbi:MAG: Uma2 family endonuclease [Planctomycetales bacterium]
MSSQLELPEIEYPESDGQPMGETDVHRGWMYRVIDILQYRYRNQRVYVTGNLLLYYERGNAKRFVSPDVFVVKECDPSERRVFKIWEEGVTPQVVFEVTSLGTRQEDLKSKHQLYQSLGVEEYFLYDPTGEYLEPPLRGYRLNGGVYRPLKGNAAGELACEQLDLRLRVEDGQLVLRDGPSGVELLTRCKAAEAAQEAAEMRNRELEAELARLRSSPTAKSSKPQ